MQFLSIYLSIFRRVHVEVQYAVFFNASAYVQVLYLWSPRILLLVAFLVSMIRLHLWGQNI